MHGHAETCSKIFQQHARVKTSRTNCREVRVHPRDERHRDLGASVALSAMDRRLRRGDQRYRPRSVVPRQAAPTCRWPVSSRTPTTGSLTGRRPRSRRAGRVRQVRAARAAPPADRPGVGGHLHQSGVPRHQSDQPRQRLPPRQCRRRTRRTGTRTRSGSRHGDRDAGPPARTVPGSGRRLPLVARPGAGDPAGAGCGPGCDDRGEVDFERYARALGSIGFDGVTVYELIDLEPPMPRLHDDIATFRKLGWSLSATGQVPSIPKA